MDLTTSGMMPGDTTTRGSVEVKNTGNAQTSSYAVSQASTNADTMNRRSQVPGSL